MATTNKTEFSIHLHLDEIIATVRDASVKVADTIRLVADAIKATIDSLRNAIAKTGDLDPITEDLLIAISGPLEKSL